MNSTSCSKSVQPPLADGRGTAGLRHGDLRWAEVALGAGLFLGFSIPLLAWNPQLINTWSPVLLGTVCLGAIFFLRRCGLARLVFAPLVWFLLACTVYYGVGPLLYIYGSEYSLSAVEYLYHVDGNDLYRTNLLNLVSVAGILVVFSIIISIPLCRPFHRPASYQLLKRGAHGFGVIGVSFTLFTNILRHRYGNEMVMPGIFYNLADCGLSSIFLYSFLLFRGVRSVKLPLIMVGAVMGYYAFTSLMKEQILQFVMVLFLGGFIARPSFRKIVIMAGLVVVVLPALQTSVSRLRNLTWTENSTHVSAVQIGKALFDPGNQFAADPAVDNGDQALWRRISYVAFQAFALHEYDAGRPGKSLKLAFWTFVPRIIYPDKPVITLGGEFSRLLLGTEDNGGTGPGFFAEAYWNNGWLGVALMSMFVGALLAVVTQFTNNLVATGNFQFFPVAFMAWRMGYRVDDWFVAVTFSSIPIMTALALVCALMSIRWANAEAR